MIIILDFFIYCAEICHIWWLLGCEMNQILLETLENHLKRYIFAECLWMNPNCWQTKSLNPYYFFKIDNLLVNDLLQLDRSILSWVWEFACQWYLSYVCPFYFLKIGIYGFLCSKIGAHFDLLSLRSDHVIRPANMVKSMMQYYLCCERVICFAID